MLKRASKSQVKELQRYTISVSVYVTEHLRIEEAAWTLRLINEAI